MSQSSYCPWQQPLLEQVERMFQAQRLPHALLLRGRNGDGLLPAARSLAAMVLCQQPVASRGCGECKPCRLLAAGSHPDLMLLQPEEKGRVIKVEGVRELVAQFAHTPQVGNWKIAVLHPASSLNMAAANALLKTLEEPPGQALLILTAEPHARVLPTLQSRCQLVRLPRPQPDQALGWLEQAGVTEDRAAALLQATVGEPLRAEEWHQANRLEDWQSFRELLPRLAEGKMTLHQAQQGLEDIALADLLDWYLGYLREQLVARVADRAYSTGLVSCVDQALEAAAELKRGTNPNAQLLVESLLMQWQRVSALPGSAGPRSVRG